jgi:hypothetical protein
MPEQFEIRADYDDSTIVVYQAFREEIAAPAVKYQKLVPPFSLDRMTWIKPSFLWMMERSGYGTKPGQEHILAIRITRAGWEEALRHAVLTSRSENREALVRVQWDPERDIRSCKLSYRSIQVGLSRRIVHRYVDNWITQIRDLSELVARLRHLRKVEDYDQAERLLPRERSYPLTQDSRLNLGMENQRSQQERS